MAKVVGWDIGGANTKVAFIRTESGKIVEIKTEAQYFPFWKREKNQLCLLLPKLNWKVSGGSRLDCIGVTMTAELSDLFHTKREGINHILDCLTQVFSDTKIFVVDVNANLRSVDAAKTEPLEVAAANWAATGWMVSHLLSDCIVVDVGSTTTSIIPVKGGRLVAAGKTDLEKLMNGELVYTGILRTNLAAIVSSVPLRGKVVRVSSELFAQSGDVHLILGNIQVKEYTTETADGRGKTRAEAMARLARIVCADTEMLTEQEIVEIATYICEKQIEQIAEGLDQVYSRLNPDKLLTPVVVAGLGNDSLAKKAAEKIGVKTILDLDELVPKGTSGMAPAVGVSLMAATKVNGGIIRWKP